MMRAGFLLVSCLVATPLALAAVPSHNLNLAERLSGIRTRVMTMQEEIIDGLRRQSEAKSNLGKIKALMRLQREERKLCRDRVEQLENTIAELESRRGKLGESVLVHRKLIRRILAEIARAAQPEAGLRQLPEKELLEAPRRKVLANMVDRSLREIEAYKADLSDADNLQARILEEQQHLAYLLQELKEQEGVLELNRQLQADIIKRKHADRAAQLDNYRKLKSAEARVEYLIQEFNARKELEHAVETERVASREMMKGAFARMRGRLPMPVAGPLVSKFGRAFDSKSGLNVFRKGIEIAAPAKAQIRAISSGRIAYSGELPGYGKVTIVDHGNHFYSLCAKLGRISKKAGDPVAAGDEIGISDDAGAPTYFEIRARNIAVNPLQWVVN
ncbi:MAG: hypothetical protein A2583_16105 [Bdellovibrionales bacterium RIFOXYD1_FULL_53_11]|nr:MAG: hypothetical protein A2583_16105 [Bdellovibrionales bacterium RIFOXYD1_FULL_53_11]